MRSTLSAGLAAFAFVALAPSARAAWHDAPLALRLTLSAGDKPPPAAPDSETSGKADDSGKAGDLDFDLLGAPPPQEAPVADSRFKTRRTMLSLHQGFGVGLLTVTTATVIVGQLNYTDRFGGGASSARYELPHAILAFTSLGLFAATGLLAILAPVPVEKHAEGLDRVTLHKIGMFTATAGMLAQGILGILTTSREGHLNQQGLAEAHLVVGYVTLGAMAFGVSALVF